MHSLSTQTSFHDFSDRGLLVEFVGGKSTEAFAELMRRHGGMVLSVCERRLGMGFESEDTAQLVFLQLWQNAEKLSNHVSLVGWLHVTACSICRDGQFAQATRQKHDVQQP
ncbi:MAG: sigma-70 family RNA polymerase sigma factor [Pirellulaceae bacterium]|nr:sigma-70 family RNA polymerase sigma factor [Pirellulaceae bacterium]